MASLVCAKCGDSVAPSSGRGRPRKYCLGCSPKKAVPRRAPVSKPCEHCGVEFESVNSGRVRFCSRECRNLVMLRVPCSDCGEPVWVGRSSAERPRCRGCRSEFEHGTYSMYRKRGCRCDLCREANRREHARWRAKRVGSGERVKPVARRDCAYCGVSFLGRVDTGQRFCSPDCAKRDKGFSGTPRRAAKAFRVSGKVRREIYEAAGWKCSLCESPVRPDEDKNHPRYPTLDHIVPRSRGGSDDRENLRLACRQCNTLRGADVDWVPVKAVA